MGEPFPTAALSLPRVLHRGSHRRAEPHPSLIPRTPAGRTSGDLETFPPGKYQYAPQKGNFDSHWIFLEFGCPSCSYFCSTANKQKLSSIESKAPSLLPAQGHSSALPGSESLLHSVGHSLQSHFNSILETTPSPPPTPQNQPYLLRLSFNLTPPSVQTCDKCLE